MVSHGCTEHLCSAQPSVLTTATHTCPQAGLTQGSQSQVEHLPAGVQVRSPPPQRLHEGVQTLTSMTCLGTKPGLPRGLSFQAEHSYPTQTLAHLPGCGKGKCGEESQLRAPSLQPKCLALPLWSCVVSDECLNLSVPPFPHLKNKDADNGFQH